MDGKKTLTIDLWKAITIVVVAMLGAAGAGLWGALVTVNSDHYTIVANAKEISQNRDDIAELSNNMKSIMTSLGDIKLAIGEIKAELRYR
jgi:hypothetical protein